MHHQEVPGLKVDRWDRSASRSRTAPSSGWDWVVADACWSWTERLFSPLAGLGQDVLLLRALDWGNAWRQRRPVSEWWGTLQGDGPHLWRYSQNLPPGWMKRYPRLGMRPLARGVRQWRRRGDQRPLALAISYPYYLALADQIQPDALIYYNMDDYALYWPECAAEVRDLEREAVARADLTVCCAQIRADELRSRVPSAREKIIHLPHGAPRSAIPHAPATQPGPAPTAIAHLPRPYLGFVGSLEDRVDWSLIARLADAFPAGSILLIGRVPEPVTGAAWYEEFRHATSRPNVHLLGWKDADEIGRYNMTCDVCLIPYLVDHPFNRVASPTKIMDYMATTRPIVATALPECRLYADIMEVAESSAAFAAAVRRIVEGPAVDPRAHARWDLARRHTWERVSERLLGEVMSREFRASAPRVSPRRS